MIVWTGWGILVVPVLFGGFALTAALGQAMGRSPAAIVVVSVLNVLILVGLWLLGTRLNRPVEGFDVRTGERVLYRNRHTLFWIPVQYWAIISGVLGLVFLVVSLF